MTEKNLTDHEIIDRIAKQIESLRCAKNRNFGFIRTYGGQVSHLLINLTSLSFALHIYIYIYIYIYIKPFKAIKTTTKHKHLLQIYITGRL